ncbi:MAG: hydroxyisourate hydrolase [Myxococcales bacterium]
MSGITTHVLDTTLGRPASGLAVSLARDEAGEFVLLAQHTTNAQGRVTDFLGAAGEIGALRVGLYRLRFETASYLRATHQSEFYPHVEILFRVEDPNGHYHIPLLLSPYGYSTYRGS